MNCATIGGTVFYSLAWWFGREIIDYIRQAEAGVTIAVAIAVVIGGILFWLHRRRSKQIVQSLETLEHASEVLAPHHEPEEFPAVSARTNRDAAEESSDTSGSTQSNGSDQKAEEKAAVREPLRHDQ
jgi:hypothetical protein